MISELSLSVIDKEWDAFDKMNQRLFGWLTKRHIAYVPVQNWAAEILAWIGHSPGGGFYSRSY
jgi:hypothetical protein